MVLHANVVIGGSGGGDKGRTAGSVGAGAASSDGPAASAVMLTHAHTHNYMFRHNTPSFLKAIQTVQALKCVARAEDFVDL